METKSKLLWWKVLICPITFPLYLVSFIMFNRCGGHSPLDHTGEIFMDCVYGKEES